MGELEQKRLAAVSHATDDAIRNIWGYVRDNQHSLNSERARRLIRELVDGAVASARSEVESLAAKVVSEQAKSRGLRKEIKRLEEELVAVEGQHE